MTTAQPAPGVYALLADGATAEIRPAAAGDFDAVREMHRAMSPDNFYLRFFSMSPAAADQEASRICRAPAADHAALLAWLAGDLVGVASYECEGTSGTAEFAVAVLPTLGMPIIGPNCFGVAVPGIALDATFGASHPTAGTAGLAVQSGGVGIALAGQLSRLGIGISSFASLGDKSDVSGNDLLAWWDQDPATKLAVLYLESFGNPRKFGHTARHIGASYARAHRACGTLGSRTARRRLPHCGRGVPLWSPAKRSLPRPASSPPATSGNSSIRRPCWPASPCPQAATSPSCPTPAGPGRWPPTPAPTPPAPRRARTAQIQDALRQLLPPGAEVTGPGGHHRDRARQKPSGAAWNKSQTTMAWTPSWRSPCPPLWRTLSRRPLPPVVVQAPRAGAARIRPRPCGCCPAGPMSAAWFPRTPTRGAPPGPWATRPGTGPGAPGRQATSRSSLICGPTRHEHSISAFLGRSPDGGWLTAAENAKLLMLLRYSPMPRGWSPASRWADGAAELGSPVVLKAEIPGLVHKSDAGAVQLDLHGRREVQAGYRALAERFESRMSGAILQPMITGGTEVIMGVVQEPVFGPLVVFGLGGVATDVLYDRSARLTPLTDTDAATLIRSVRAAPLLLGHRGAPPADLTALENLLLRVARLAEDFPQVAELDLNPVIARPDGAHVVDARIHLMPRSMLIPTCASSGDPFLPATATDRSHATAHAVPRSCSASRWPATRRHRAGPRKSRSGAGSRCRSPWCSRDHGPLSRNSSEARVS